MTEDAPTPEQIETELAYFTGTQNYYQYLANVVLTDGAKHLADRAGAYWLMDVVASWQVEKRVACQPFQHWKLEVEDDNTATVVADDGNGNEIARQEIPFTDFPLRSTRLYLVKDGKYRVLMLPSEY
jgi:hypothetical protein